MELTDKALKAAIKKAVEVGLLPKAGFIDVIETNWRKVKDVVEAALAETEADVASRPRELLMDVLQSARGIDHPILDDITGALEDLQGTWVVEREAERLVFNGPSTPGQRFEIIVRPIDGDEGEEPSC
jgi:hypothetical protein